LGCRNLVLDGAILDSNDHDERLSSGETLLDRLCRLLPW
jgi:hypothetical protein